MCTSACWFDGIRFNLRRQTLFDTETEGQRDRETEGQRDKETKRRRDKETKRQRDKETKRQRDKGTKRQRDKETKRQRDKETKRQRDKEVMDDSLKPLGTKKAVAKLSRVVLCTCGGKRNTDMEHCQESR